jgi:DNA-binding PadR family transcriptional regulator
VALLNSPGGRAYGLDLARQSSVRVGSMYPILQRLLEAGWITDEWEDADPVEVGRPRRRFYSLTREGVEVALRALDDWTAAMPQRGHRMPGLAT